MGGSGSGNRWNHSSRATCEGLRRVDLRYMRKRGLLVDGRAGTLSWSIGDEPHGSISFVVSHHALQLLYSTTDDLGQRQAVDEEILFDFSRQHLGGDRRWLICPRCRRRCVVLYGGRLFRCRLCYRLAYQSQNEAPMWRSLSQAQKHRQKLGGSGSMDEEFPEKPKGMHWRTYARHLRKAERLEGRVNALEETFLAGLMQRLRP